MIGPDDLVAVSARDLAAALAASDTPMGVVIGPSHEWVLQAEKMLELARLERQFRERSQPRRGYA